MQLNFELIKTRVVKPPKDEIWDIIDSLKVGENDIVFITSKILSIHQGRTVKDTGSNKEKLIKKEADKFLEYYNKDDNFTSRITITDGNLILAAGIDASNADGHFVLWPKDVDKLCQEIRERLTNKFKLKRLGVVATDSRTSMLRWGVTGFTIGLAGVEPLEDIRGSKDLFGREIMLTKVNKIDPLTSMAVLLMGETNTCTPIAILRNYKGIKFNENASLKDFKIPPEHDIYRPLLEAIK
jgi:F420-0:gamma-glutamyl ligase